MDAMHHQPVTRSNTEPTALHWEVPSPNWAKVNWDVATCADHDKIRVGVLLRDCSGSDKAYVLLY